MSVKKFELSNVMTVMLNHFSHDFFPATIPVLVPILLEKYDLSLQLGALFIIMIRMPSVLNPLLGAYADRFKLRYVVIFAPLVTALFINAVYYSPNYYLTLFLLLMTGLSSTMYHIPAPVMMKHFAGNKIGTGMSLFMVGGETARSLGPLALSAILEYYYLGTASFLLIGIFALTIVFWKKFNKATIAEEYQAKQAKTNGIKEVLKRNKKLYMVLAVIILVKTFFTASLSAFLPTFMTFKGVGIAKAGVALAILEIAGAAGTFLAGTLSDKFGRYSVLKVSVVLAPLLYVVFLLAPGAWVLALLVLLGLTVFAVNPIIMALIQENEKDYPAAANSIYMTMNFAFSFSILYLIGLIGDIWSLETAYTVCSIVGFVSIPFVFILPKIEIKS